MDFPTRFKETSAILALSMDRSTVATNVRLVLPTLLRWWGWSNSLRQRLVAFYFGEEVDIAHIEQQSSFELKWWPRRTYWSYAISIQQASSRATMHLKHLWRVERTSTYDFSAVALVLLIQDEDRIFTMLLIVVDIRVRRWAWQLETMKSTSDALTRRSSWNYRRNNGRKENKGDDASGSSTQH